MKTESTKALAVILARSGSKGVPGKNVAPVAGKPCIQWTIEAAKQATSLSRILVSSDDPQALAIAKGMEVGAVVRPADLATDYARVDDAARHAVQAAATEVGIVVILYANVPIRPAGLIDRAVEMLRTTGADSVQSYAPVGKHHPWWTARLNGKGEVVPWEGEVLNHNVFRRQDLPAAAIPDGGVLAVTRRALFLEVPGVPPGPHAFFGADRRGLMNPEGSVVDIDSRVDLIVADTLLRAG
ncbi:MAG TPA: acylneuraminate cytidylyltransferase family protein [Phycisphaerales bacterium]|nr:acylneuraminate cytidylyltransferase family protein [Phycisphaerales bacterium]